MNEHTFEMVRAIKMITVPSFIIGI